MRSTLSWLCMDSLPCIMGDVLDHTKKWQLNTLVDTWTDADETSKMVWISVTGEARGGSCCRDDLAIRNITNSRG